MDVELPAGEREAFYQTVWKIVRLIPVGRVSTYGQVAGYIPCPAGVTVEDYKAFRARWVGSAMSASPQDVPWQRVINAQGKISIRDGAKRQRALLEGEGVVFDDHDRVNLKIFGWDGPEIEWLRENGLSSPDEASQLSLFH
jgi:methylated-DNA-protein-cysteine methyltransferase related protein